MTATQDWIEHAVLASARELGIPCPQNAVWYRNTWPGQISKLAVPQVFSGCWTMEKLEGRFRERCAARARQLGGGNRSLLLATLRFFGWDNVAADVEAEVMLFP